MVMDVDLKGLGSDIRMYDWPERTAVCCQIEKLFSEVLQVDIPSQDTDLIDTGIIDSLIFLSLLLNLEQVFNIQVSLDDFEVDDFRSIESIANYVLRQSDFTGTLVET
jgi:acyl carrier protein